MAKRKRSKKSSGTVFKNLSTIIFNAPTVVDDKVQKGLLLAITLVIFGPLIDIILGTLFAASWAKAIFVILPLIMMFWLLATFPWPVTAGGPILLTEIGRKIVRGAIIGVLVEILLGLYIALVPIDQNLGHALLLWPITLAIVISSTLLPRGTPRKAVVTTLLVLVGLFTYSFFGSKAVADRNTPEAKAQAQKAAAQKAAAEVPGSTICPGAGTLKIPNSGMTVSIDTCQSGLMRLPDSWKGVRMNPTDPNQKLCIASYTDTFGIVTQTGETACVGGQPLPLDPKDRLFRAWSDRKGFLEIMPKYPNETQTASGGTSTNTEVPPEESGWTYVKGEVRRVNADAYMLTIIGPKGVKEFYAPGPIVKSPFSENGWMDIRCLERGDDVRIRFNQKDEADRIDLLRDWRVKQNGKTLEDS